MASRLLLGAESLDQDIKPTERASILSKNKSSLVYEYHSGLKNTLEGELSEAKDTRASAYQKIISSTAAESAIALKQRKGSYLLVNLS